MRKLIVICTVLAAAGMLAVTATAQAQQAKSATHTSRGAGPSVPSGVETAVSLASCPAGSSPTVSPGPPAAVNVVVQRSPASVSVKLAGDWLSTNSTTFTVKCSATVTKKSTVTVTATPPEDAAVGGGGDALQNLIDQFSGDYNATLTTAPHGGLYHWSDTNPTTGAIGDKITPKANCGPILRPDGSSAGIQQLIMFEVTADHKYDCLNFASSSRARAAQDPPFMTGGIAFAALADDAVTWATPKTTDAPETLTPAQLAKIYTCEVRNWHQVGGKSGPVRPFLPQGGSGIRSFFETALIDITPGPCVSSLNNTLQDGDGVNPALNNPGAIYIYSIGQYIAQRYHSAKCLNSSCTPNTRGVICTPNGMQNTFGCDTHGPMVLKEINGTAPTTGTGRNTVVNPAFPATFIHTLFDVVPFDANTTDHIPGSEPGTRGGVNLEKIFGASGWACTSKTAQTDIKNYGFVPIGTICGNTN
jgi:ABC-type phosphate transport system substrate-binding protein